MKQLEILYFAWVREAVGKDSEQIDHPGVDVRIIDVIEKLGQRGEGYARAFADTDRIRAALDQEFAPLAASLGHARELALFPPVTGG